MTPDSSAPLKPWPDLRCLNCDTAIVGLERFCPHCGQRTDTARLSTGDILRDLLQTFVNVERGPLAFALALLTRPGGVAREYVEGKRRRHYGPFATLVVLVGLTALAINASGVHMLERDLVAAEPRQLLERHFNLLLLAQLPLLGGICAIVFRGARLTVPEHMVLAAYTLGVRAVVLALLVPVAYLSSRTAATQEQAIGFWLVWYLYFGWAASQFYAGPRLVNWFKGVAAAALGHGAIMLIITVGAGLYLAVARGLAGT